MAGKKMLKKIVLNDKLCTEIIKYCELNNINDVNEFTNNCTQQGFNIIRFGFTPKDNLMRQKLGIKEPDKINQDETKKLEEKKEVEQTTKRKIRIIKKD